MVEVTVASAVRKDATPQELTRPMFAEDFPRRFLLHFLQRLKPFRCNSFMLLATSD
jgi:hypothetical protein